MRLIFDRQPLATHFTKGARVIFYAAILLSALQVIALGAVLEICGDSESNVDEFARPTVPTLQAVIASQRKS